MTDPVELAEHYGDNEPVCYCELCGGLNMLLGQLGTRLHLRCRDCGMDSSCEER